MPARLVRGQLGLARALWWGLRGRSDVGPDDVPVQYNGIDRAVLWTICAVGVVEIVVVHLLGCASRRTRTSRSTGRSTRSRGSPSPPPTRPPRWPSCARRRSRGNAPLHRRRSEQDVSVGGDP